MVSLMKRFWALGSPRVWFLHGRKGGGGQRGGCTRLHGGAQRQVARLSGLVQKEQDAASSCAVLCCAVPSPTKQAVMGTDDPRGKPAQLVSSLKHNIVVPSPLERKAGVCAAGRCGGRQAAADRHTQQCLLTSSRRRWPCLLPASWKATKTPQPGMAASCGSLCVCAHPAPPASPAAAGCPAPAPPAPPPPPAQPPLPPAGSRGRCSASHVMLRWQVPMLRPVRPKPTSIHVARAVQANVCEHTTTSQTIEHLPCAPPPPPAPA